MASFLRRPIVAVLGYILLTATAGGLLAATIYWTLSDPRWIVFLSGVLLAAIPALGVRASHAEWRLLRRDRKLLRMQQQLEEERARSRRTLRAYETSEARFRLLSDAIPSPLFFIDRNERCRQANAAAVRLTHRSDLAEGIMLRDVVGETAYADMRPFVSEALGGQASDFDLAWTGQGAEPMAYSARYRPYPAGSAQPAGFFLLLSARRAPPPAAPAAAVAATAEPGADRSEPIDDSHDSDDGTGISLQGPQGETIYLRSIASELMGREDPRGRLVHALEHDEFILYAQSIMPLKAGLKQRNCQEILVRLKEEEDNLVPPGAFLAVAEHYGMVGDIDRWVLRSLLKHCRALGVPLPEQPLYCINLSTAALENPPFADFVRQQVQGSGIDTSWLCFEIAEPDIVYHHEAVLRFVHLIKPLGCRITADAFGSIKGTFGGIRDLPLDFVKLDGVIVQNMLRNATELARARAIATVCRTMGALTIAELVESEETLALLRDIGIDYAQGFGVACPAPLRAMALAPSETLSR